MTGKEKIIEKIRADAAAECGEISAQAKAEIEKIVEKTRMECESLAEARAAEAAHAAERVCAAAASSSALARRNALLRARRAEIAQTVRELLRYLNTLPDGTYFEALYRCAAQFGGAEGVIALNARDLARIPADFMEKLAAAGVNATVAGEPVEIAGGFVLKCGDIDYSADFEAMVNEKRDALEDLINRKLFEE